MEQERISSLSELVRRMQSGPRGGLHTQVIDAMTTNETLWFRDAYPYEVMKSRVLPELVAKYPGQRLRIWSAACSSGQEPYSLAMTIDEYERSAFGQLRAGVQIVATELSTTMLEASKRGEYDALAIARGLLPERLNRYFEKTGVAGRWRIKNEIR